MTSNIMLLMPLAMVQALIQYTNAKLLCLNGYLNGNTLGKTAVGICGLECSLQWEMGRSVLGWGVLKIVAWRAAVLASEWCNYWPNLCH